MSSTTDAPPAGEASSSDAGLTPAQRLLAKHEAAEKAKHLQAEYHKPEIEEVADEEDPTGVKALASNAGRSETATESAPNGSPSNASATAPMSATAKGKQKAQDPPKKPNVLDTQSEELFPSLGSGPKAPAPATPGAWGGNKNVKAPPLAGMNGATNGTARSATPRSSGTSTPTAGVLAPASPNAVNGQRRTGPPQMSLPGKNTAELILYNTEIDSSKDKRGLLEELKRKNRVVVNTREQLVNNQLATVFTASGQIDHQVQLALKRISKELTSSQKVKMEVPASVKRFIIGAGGRTIKDISERTGARVQLPKISNAAPTMDEDESATVMVEIEGDAVATRNARLEIERIVNANAADANLKLKDIPPEFFPFIAGPHNRRIAEMERDAKVRVIVPQFQTWQHQPPPRAPTPNERPSFVPHPDMHIQVTGEREAAQQARQKIYRHVEFLRQQLMVEEQNYVRGQHPFIVGERGMSPHDFLEETGCIVILPPPHDDSEDISIIGPTGKLEEGLAMAERLAAELMNHNIDPRKYISDAPQGPDTHARALAQYLTHRRLEEEFRSSHSAHATFPYMEGSSPSFDIFARDNAKLSKARQDLIQVIKAHPPQRMSQVEVNPFFHPHLREQCAHPLKNDLGVHMIVPTNEESDQVLLVFEGPATSDPNFRINREVPDSSKLEKFQEALEQARNQILSIIGDQQDIRTKQVPVAEKYHDRVRKFVNREQASEQGTSPSSFPVQLMFDGFPVSSSTRPVSPTAAAPSRREASLRGPGRDVDDLEAKIIAFLKQAEQDEQERGYITTLEFPSKFNGYLVGKNGANINDLRDRFDVDLKINNDKVQIKGPQSKGEECKRHLISQLKKWEDETTFNLKVDSQYHGDIIGRSGENVKRLEERHDVRIQFPRSTKVSDDSSVAETSSEAGGSRNNRANPPPNEIVIRGPKQGAEKAKSEILDFYQYLQDNSHSAKVTVSKKQIPSLMGRGGREMELLRAETQAQIDVPNSGEVNGAGDRVELKIKGSKQAVEAAKKAIQTRAKAFDALVTDSLDVDKKYHQTLIGSGGKSFRSLLFSTVTDAIAGSNIRRIVIEAGGPENSAQAVRFPSRDSPSNTITVHWTQAVVSKIVAAIQAFVSERENMVSDTLEVPTSKHRQLIGRGGEIRRGLEERFHVSIDVPRNGSGNTTVKISGPSEDVPKAKAHIKSMFKDPEGETIHIPKSAHHAVAKNGNLFHQLRSKHNVTVDHGGQRPPRKPQAAPAARTRTNGATPLITDDPDMDAFSWDLVETDNANGENGTIAWILSGPDPEKVAAAKAQVEAALEAASAPFATGYLILPDPRSHGRIIGPGGRNINNIRQKTGCDIQVPKAGNAGGQEAIVIIGSKADCEEAKAMILETIKHGEV